MTLNWTLQLLMTPSRVWDGMMTRTAITPCYGYLFRTVQFILSNANNYRGIAYKIPCEVRMLSR